MWGQWAVWIGNRLATDCGCVILPGGFYGHFTLFPLKKVLPAAPGQG